MNREISTTTRLSYRLFLLATIVACTVTVGVFIWRAVSFCSYPYPIENGEGICAHMAKLLIQGNLYKNISSVPLIVANYPPVYFLLNAAIPASNVFFSGRFLSVLALLGTGALIFLITMRYTRRTAAALFSVAFFFMYPWINKTGILYRVDMTAAFFSLLGFYLYGSKIRHAHLIAAACFLIGLYTKHTVWAGPFAAYTWMFMRDRKQALREFLWFTAAGAAIFLLITVITHGWFLRHLVLYNAYEYRSNQLMYYLKEFFLTTGIIWLFAVIGLFTSFKVARPVWLYTLFSFALLLMTGREGASQHYFIEASCAVAILSGIAIMRFADMGKLQSIICIAGCCALAAHLAWNKDILTQIRIPQKSRLIQSILYDAIAGEPGRVLAEDTGVIIMTGKTVYVHTFAISKLIESEILEPDVFYDLIADRYFSLVVLNSKLTHLSYTTRSRFTREALMIIYRYYTFDKQIGNSYLYRKKRR